MTNWLTRQASAAPDRQPAAADPPARTAEPPQTRGERGLRSDERRLLTLLGLPTLSLALATTTVAMYLPTVAHRFTGSTTVIGLIIGGEGLMALWIPLVVGAWSDRLRTPLGGRLPFLLVATPPAVVALVALGFAGSIAVLAVAVLVFFSAYFVAYEPYRALYPDLVDTAISGRAQGTQAIARGAGTALAVIGGGMLLGLARPAPFVAAAVVLAGSTVAFALGLMRRGTPATERAAAAATAVAADDDGTPAPAAAAATPIAEIAASVPEIATPVREIATPVREIAGQLWRLLCDLPALRAFLVANMLWELSLGALKTFVVLYITVGLGYDIESAALIVGAVAVCIVVGAAGSGALGDRIGHARVLTYAMPVYAAGLLLPGITQNQLLLALILPFISIGGGLVMTMPYAVLIPLMPPRDHGALTGYYGLSRGLGTMLGPLLAGAAIGLLDGPLGSTQGYAAMWMVCSGAIVASLPVLALMRRHAEAEDAVPRTR